MSAARVRTRARTQSRAQNRARANRVVSIALAVAFVALFSTAVLEEAPHEWIGIAAFLLTAAHLILSRKRIGVLARKRGIGGKAGLALDAALIVCLIGLVASSLVLSEHVYAWLPALPGTAVARVAHLACSYWGFVLVFVHAGIRFSSLAGRLRQNTALRWACRAVFAVCLVYGAVSFFQLDMVSYLTLRVQFAFADPSVSIVLRLAQYASIGVAISGIAHYLASAARSVRRA